ncbi:MAG: asparagine synthase C-terminal domain-containing protein, partial [Phycisphaeraceae bacterium]|nr:asparagine synthase C-terminal domain-containing protein [Phycisphaeraceae bacterium]
PAVDPAAAAAYLRDGYVPAPHTIYRSTWKRRPGEWISVGLDGTHRRRLYWDLRTIATQGVAAPTELSDQEAQQRLDELVGESVLRRTLSDVPLGAFLSGGIDSSLVAALLQHRRSERLKTFCIGFEESAFDESVHARRVAERLGTDHTEHRITTTEARDVVPKLAQMYDEPFGDSSQIPTHLVSVLARRHVTVALSGDGGDELFAGYDRHRRAEAVWDRLQHLPRSMRRMAAVVARGLGPKLLGPAARVSGSRALQTASRRVRRAADLLAAEEGTALPLALISQWPDPAALVPGAAESRGLFFDQELCDQVPHLADRMRLLDALAYLPGDLLTKVDRASMAVGLEVRVPLLDHRVVEFAFGLPRRLLIREGRGKWILRRVLSRYLPGEWFERPKQGFAVPVGAWLRGPLRDWAESMLDEQALSADGLLDPKPIRAAWAAHRRGEGGLDGPLWTVLMLQAWRARWDR